MRILLVFTILLLLSFSCKKDITDDGVIKGHVSDFYTKAPIPQARVFLLSKDAESVMNIYKQDAATFSDNAGAFSFKFDMASNRAYIVKADKPFYESIETDVYKDSNDKKNLKVSLIPYGWAHVYVKYTGQSDRVVFYGPITINAPKDSNIFIQLLGNENHEIGYVTYKNSIESTHLFNIYLPALDTVDYHIEY